MIGIDLFSGSGGMSLGAKQAGIKVCLAVEIDPNAAATYKFNHPETKVLIDDICNLKGIDLPRSHDGTVLFGGPPCQGFSTSNQRTRSTGNKQNWLYKEFVRIAVEWKPDWVVFENVKGVLETEGGFFLQQTITDFECSGYTCTWFVLNAADYGVPQERSRLFIVGSKKGVSINAPKKQKKPQRITVHEAIGDLPDLPNGSTANWLPYKWKSKSTYLKKMRGDLKGSSNHLVTKNAPHILERYRYVPQGGNWENIPAHLMNNYTDRSRCHTGIYRRLENDEPSVVLGNYRKNMLIHPIQDRGLSVREAARLQSFPDWYEFKGSIGYQQQQVGNAVPPLLAKAVFEAIVTMVLR